MMTLRQPLSLVFFFSLLVSCGNRNESGTVQTEEVRAAKAAGRLLTGTVVGISDGDTFRLLMEDNKNVRVRLHGVDAPEKGQDYSTQARQALSDLVFSKPVAVIQKTRDRYGRVVGVIYAGSINVNEALLQSGMVWHYTEYDKNPRWAQMERNARMQKEGLWSKRNPSPPWLWRKAKRAEATEAE